MHRSLYAAISNTMTTRAFRAEDFGGAMIVEGEITQLRDRIHSDWYRDTIIKARHLVDNLNEVRCVTGDAIQGNIERVVKARKELGIT